MGGERAAAGGAAGESGDRGGGEGLRAARSEEREGTSLVGAAMSASRAESVLWRRAAGAAAGELRTAAVLASADISRRAVAVRADLPDSVEAVVPELADGSERTTQRSRIGDHAESGAAELEADLAAVERAGRYETPLLRRESAVQLSAIESGSLAGRPHFYSLRRLQHHRRTRSPSFPSLASGRHRLRPRPARQFLLHLDGPAADLRFPPHHLLARCLSPCVSLAERRLSARPHPLRELPGPNAEVLVAASHALHPGAGRRPPPATGFRGDRRAAGDLRDAQSGRTDREGDAGG